MCAQEVGEGGGNLSGGQQMRLSLARATYAALSEESPGLVLLDDPISALDTHLGRHVFERCICGLLRHHTVTSTIPPETPGPLLSHSQPAKA